MTTLELEQLKVSVISVMESCKTLKEINLLSCDQDTLIGLVKKQSECVITANQTLLALLNNSIAND